jgi:hypothetical protein
MVQVGHVSWLEAGDPPSRVSPVASWIVVPREADLLQWRGRAGFSPASVTTHLHDSVVGAKLPENPWPATRDSAAQASRTSPYFSIFL